MVSEKDSFGPWDPGIDSELPVRLRSRESIYLEGSSETSFSEAKELSQLTGISCERLVVFTVERLVLHELIVKVTSDVFIEEGEEEEELGKNFRNIVSTIMVKYILPHKCRIDEAFCQVNRDVCDEVKRIVDHYIFSPPKVDSKPKFCFGIFKKNVVRYEPSIAETQFKALNDIKRVGLEIEDLFESSVYKNVYVVLSSLFNSNGRIINDSGLLVKLISGQVLNDYGSRVVRGLIGPLVDEAVASEGFQVVNESSKPVLISLKGASASGKSTIRPLLHKVIQDRGFDCYGTISPDIWRRLLLDYESLGVDFKYAGRLTSIEVSIVDQKLDKYIREKSVSSGSIPNLVVDRFRFDSFSSRKVSQVLHETYVRHVDSLHMYFLIIPPEETVERGWRRGIERGRYKSVEDFLGHCVEAYVGMPKIFFKWIAYEKPKFIYTFLDNSVDKGCVPKVVASGCQSEMNVYDPVGLFNIVRYQKINVHADNADDVYLGSCESFCSQDFSFLIECIELIPKVCFLLGDEGEVYLIFEGGDYSVLNREALDIARRNPVFNAFFDEVVSGRTQVCK